MKSNRFWLLLLGSVCAVCLACAALLPRLASPGVRARISQNGAVIRTLSLDEEQEFTLSAPNGGSNTVTVRDGKIRVSHATCPDQICVKQGWVDARSTPIVCLPNGLVIEIQGGDSTLDAQTK